MKLTAKTNEFMEMFTLMSMDGLYNPVVVAVKKGIITMVAKDVSDTTFTVQKYKGITIEDGDDEKLVFDTDEMLQSLKLFKSDDDISISVIDSTIIISNTEDAELNDVITIPQIDTSVLDITEFPYKIVKGVPVIKNKVTEELIDFSEIVTTIPIKYLREIVKRANFADIHPKIYTLTFDDGKLIAKVGEKSKYQKCVETTIKVEGTGAGELIIGNGFEEMVVALSGDITMHAMVGAPMWFTMKSDKNIVHVLMAPAMLIEE
jgi:hypothetical protein